ncbi:IMPACT family protein [Rothia aerolata]|uniref:YigZ family protein n=1 Tax=Rothia aerolata TaxID=1812262 RepID=A0A917MQG5_9MICC|nr:YigZ family protein [Rothia aerolata]GGH57067.1 YigZ family protein [Rothia aerolata]
MTAEESRANQYTVLSSFEPVESLLEIKKSEFIGHVKRVQTESEARAYIEEIRKKYHDARHVCSAFVLGPDRETQRSSDDGEPAGTAGIPMLQALLNRRTSTEDESVMDLSDICAVVVRYFGGIKLGAGGLVRAYTDAVVQVLDEAELVPRRRLRMGAIETSFAEAGKLENELRAAGIHVDTTDYGTGSASIIIGVFDSPASKAELEEQLAALTAGASSVAWQDTLWV